MVFSHFLFERVSFFTDEPIYGTAVPRFCLFFSRSSSATQRTDETAFSGSAYLAFVASQQHFFLVSFFGDGNGWVETRCSGSDISICMDSDSDGRKGNLEFSDDMA